MSLIYSHLYLLLFNKLHGVNFWSNHNTDNNGTNIVHNLLRLHVSVIFLSFFFYHNYLSSNNNLIYSTEAQVSKALVCMCVCVCGQSCLILCDPMDCTRLAPLSMRILQARILEWVAISSSRGSSWLRDQTHVSCVSCISRWVLYHSTIWEAQAKPLINTILFSLEKSAVIAKDL